MSDPDKPKPHILIVEDEVLIRGFMRDVLEEVGFKVHEAANADEALQLVTSQEFAALISDIEMPRSGVGCRY
jgi:CheY-like chemotaxis protein